MPEQEVHSLAYDRALVDFAIFYGSMFPFWFENFGSTLMRDYWKHFPQEILSTPLDSIGLRIWFEDEGKAAYERWEEESHGVRFIAWGPIGQGVANG
jgi:hypothetical protein